MIHSVKNIVLLLITILLYGCSTTTPTKVVKQKKFERFFCWGSPANQAEAAKFASAGVTDIVVRNYKQYTYAKTTNMNIYWKVFLPVGPHKQVMSIEEEKHCNYINGTDLNKNLTKDQKMKIIHKRRLEKKHQYGGHYVVDVDTLSDYRIACFISDSDFSLTQKHIDKLLKDAPKDVVGIYLDFIGYTNFTGCYCQQCLLKYQNYLKIKNLKDTNENKNIFYRDEMISYYNKVIDYIKSKKPHFKTVIHAYPAFKYEFLYGNRTKADFCGQTVSWYFKWNEDKIKKYTKYVINHAKDYHSHPEGLPFIGLNIDKTSSLGYKTPQDVEFELQKILEAGGKSLLICSGRNILADGYYEVFKKYFAK